MVTSNSDTDIDFSFLKQVNYSSPWLVAYRWLAEPYEDPLPSNDPDDDGMTPFDIYVRLWNSGVIEPQEIRRFRNLIIKTLKRFPPTELYPEMVMMLIKLDIRFDPNLFFVSNLNLFPPFIATIIKQFIVYNIPMIDDVKGVVLEYL